MEAREPVALPVLAEPAHVVEVVRPEVQDRGARLPRGEGGKEERRQDEHRENGQIPPCAHRSRGRRSGYVVTSTAA